MTVSDLSDKQLFALTINLSLEPHLREMIFEEFTKRNFTSEYQTELQAGYKRIIPVDGTTLVTWQKILIVIMSPTFLIWFIGAPIHSWLANQYISKGQLCKWRQYWKYLAIGWAFWTLIVFAVAKLFLKF